MPVRFKCQSEYQQSYRASRSRSVSPQRWAPLAGLRSDHMGISREPALQRRKKLGSGGLAQSCSSLLCPPDPPQTSRAAPSAGASRSHSGSRKEPKPPASPGAEPGTPTGPRPAADPEPPVEPRPPVEPESGDKHVKSRPHKPDSQPQLSRPVTSAADAQQLSATEQQHALRRAGGQRSEYLRQFGWKKAGLTASPLLTAEQLLHSSSRSVPPFKKNAVPMETEYGQSFQGLAPPTGPILRRHVEHERVPLFHTHKVNMRRREEPGQDDPAPQGQAPPQVQRGHRKWTEYESSFRSPLCRILEEGGATDGEVPQVKELRRQASAHRRRAWGLHFSRDHFNQLRSEHNALWEPTDTPDSTSDPRSGRPLTSDLRHDPDGPSSSSTVEPLDLASRSGRSSRRSDRNSPTAAAAQRRQEEEENQEEGEEEGEEEGRLPTPRLKTLPVQRTHLDLTTPAAGGAILVGKLRSSDDSSPTKQQRCGSAVSVATGSVADVPVKRKEAWSEQNSSHCSSTISVHHRKPATSPSSSKPIRTKEPPPSPVAPPPLIPPPHCIQGALRHADFQHNGDLGLRFRELHRSGSDEDDRLSVMSWRSAASCSMASAVLERAQKRRENFWGKR